MRDSVVEFIRLELNHNIRNTNKVLSFIESILLSTYEKYKVINIEYISPGIKIYGFHIYFQSFRNKLICFRIQVYQGGYYISMPHITRITPYATIRIIDFCQQRNFAEILDNIHKMSFLGDNENTEVDIKRNLIRFIQINTEFLALEEVDKMLHSDYWAEDIYFDWREG